MIAPNNSLPVMLNRLADAAGKWARAGMPVADSEQLRLRATACHACPEWDATAYAGAGRCTQCGCTALKLVMATEDCPLERWPKKEHGQNGSLSVTTTAR